MAQNVSLNSVNYQIPETAEDNWSTEVTSYLVALASGLLPKSGGAFTLTSDVDFGANYGLKSLFFAERGTSSSIGAARLNNNSGIGWRNAANSADILLKINASNQLVLDDILVITQTQLNTTNTNVSTNASDIGALEVDMLAAESDISTLQGQMTSTVSNTGINAAAISAAELDIAANTTLANTKQDDVINNRGSIVVGNASGEASELAIGSSGKVLTSDGTDVSWETPTGGGASLNVYYPTANVTSPESGATYAFDTDTSARTLTLPALDASNDIVFWVADLDNNAATNNITIDASTNSQTISGLTASTNYTIDVDGGWVKLSRDANTSTWSIDVPEITGVSILADNNTWTGTNTFTDVDITGGLSFDGGDTITQYSVDTATANGSFTGGNLKFTRIGDLVTVSSTSLLTHASGSSTVTSGVIIPAAYRPSAGVEVVATALTFVARFGVTAAGEVRVLYYDTDGAAITSRVNPGGLVTVSYNV